MELGLAVSGRTKSRAALQERRLQGCPSTGDALPSHLAVLQELNLTGRAGCWQQSQTWQGDELGARVYPEMAGKGAETKAAVQVLERHPGDRSKTGFKT